MSTQHEPAPRVSIIVNAYNGEAFLAEALDSARAQTHQDWELVLWDDVSTDGSAEVFHSYDDPRFRYFLAPEHTPLGVARHMAIGEARGEWLAFLDQDDIWSPDKLQQQLALVDAEPPGTLGLVYGRATAFTPDGAERDYDHHFEGRALPEGDIFGALMSLANFVPMSSSMVSREVYDAVGGIPPAYTTCVDYYLFAIIARSYGARAVQEPCCRYRLHDDNMSATHAMRSHVEALAIVESWAEHIDATLLRRRRRVYHTLIGLEELRSGVVGAGLRRLLTRGSLPYLLSRPFARAARRLRRRASRRPGP